MRTMQLLIICYTFLVFSEFSNAADILTANQSITNEKSSLVSSAQIFELGFFSPKNSKNQYLGIWYKSTPDVVVWVANRNNPLTDSFGELTISNSSNQLILLNSSKSIVWSSNSSERVTKEKLVAQLLDSGNLVLKENDGTNSEIYLWQSFDYPSDTLLAGMKFGWNFKFGLERRLTSWKSPDDPSDGDFTFRMTYDKGLPQEFVFKGSLKLYRTGPWNGLRFSGLSVMLTPVFKPIFVSNEVELYYAYELVNNSSALAVTTTRLTLNSSGLLQRLVSNDDTDQDWHKMFSAPNDPCDSYGHCGPNCICRINREPICECLPGFSPKSQGEWQVLDWSKGCSRRTSLVCGKGEGFMKLVGVKLPDLLEIQLNKSMNLEECRKACLNNCSCTAYANSDIREGGSGCVMWFGDLVDMRGVRVEGSEQEMYIRLPSSELRLIQNSRRKRTLKTILLVSLICAVCSLFLVLWCIVWKTRRKIRDQNRKKEHIELPLFDFTTITTATNHFSPANMIGRGGFGPVYKGILSTGQEIAVKRLSKDSGQGLKEFKNEVDLIAKLQHKNLVALLGCCIQRDERILIYEYMPHKILDHFIFDNKRSHTLLWEKNFDIVMGIARGLLYLHQDSKLQIIHRDLKASNILLDINMNPKISDFGLAKIFKSDEKECRTKRVVGTYGYMSPEYAVDGKFSVKSDVFSFGVLLLEMVSGKKNRRFSHLDHHHNLLGHAWLLWNEDKALELMDSCFKDSCVESQVLRCIHVGLLCVQKFSEDRPTMSSVVFMLSNDEANLPQPKEPGFFIERSSIIHEGSTSRTNELVLHTKNEVTLTLLLDGR